MRRLRMNEGLKLFRRVEGLLGRKISSAASSLQLRMTAIGTIRWRYGKELWLAAVIGAPASCITPAIAEKPPGSAEVPAAVSSSPPQRSALDVIESGRGGRHWVDEKTAPPRTPGQTLASLKIEEGYTVSLFAAEPLVMDPVAICFDAMGLMYAVEYGDYPVGPEEGGDPLSKIVMLEDRDGDGRADRRTVFADKLDFAHSMMAYRGGLLVGAKSEILYLRDDDGDGVADHRETLFEGFKPAHPQMQIGMPRWGMDNWVSLNYGPGTVVASGKSSDAAPRTLPRKDFWFNPRTLDFRSDSGLGQYGNTVDRWGRRYYCTNRNPIMTTFLTPWQAARNPYHVATHWSYDVAPSGGDSRVYPRVRMKSNYLSHAGTHTSACGTTAYLGGLGDESFQSSVFVCEPIGHLVTRSIIRSDGLRLTSDRASERSDFIASDDTWFRPSSLATGPDGALYLADMYRLWVEHPKFLPPEIAAQLDWRAGEDRGRIYRIVPEGDSGELYRAPEAEDEWVGLLSSPNAWQQCLGQRVLVENQAHSQIEALRNLLADAEATTRLRALWTLHGLDAVEAEDVFGGLSDEAPECRVAALQMASPFLSASGLRGELYRLVDDSDVRVRFQLAITLAEDHSPEATECLVALARRDGCDPWFADGLMTSVADRSLGILKALVADTEWLQEDASGGLALISQLASVVAVRGDAGDFEMFFDSVGRSPEAAWTAAAVSGFGSGLRRYRGDLGRLTLSKLVEQPPASLADSVEGVKRVLNANRKIASNSGISLPKRLAAIGVLAHLPLSQSEASLRGMLSIDQPASLQKACISTLQSGDPVLAAGIVLDRWSQLLPDVRAAAMTGLLRRTETTRMTLEAMADGKLKPSALVIDQRVRLLKHANEQIRASASDLFGGAVSKDRQRVVKDYEMALTEHGDRAGGLAVFKRVCASCHRFGDLGHTTGPDLSDVNNRSRAALLYEILDPNSKVEPRFAAYSVLTVDGDVFTGLVQSESGEAVVLKMAEGKTRTIGRGEIDQIKASDVSLMPEGIEKDISPKQMADLLTYLTER